MRRGPQLAFAVMLVSAFMVTTAVAAGAPPALSLSQEDEVTVQPEAGQDTATVELVVADSGASVPASVAFKAVKASPVKVTKVAPEAVAGGDATPIEVTLAGLGGLSETESGSLVVRGGAVPLVQKLKVAPALEPSRDWAKTIVVGSLIAMALLGLGIAFVAWRKGRLGMLKTRAPGPKWSFSSWATTLTAAGAVLATVLASASFPDEPKQIEKDTLVALSLLFGALVVIAPFVFQALRNPKASPTDQEGGLWGFNWSLLVACSITCAAVLGQLACLALLAWELIGGGGWGVAALAALGVVALLAVYYFCVTAWYLAVSDWPALAAAAAGKAKEEAGLTVGVAGPREAGEAATVQVVSAPPQPASWSLP